MYRLGVPMHYSFGICGYSVPLQRFGVGQCTRELLLLKRMSRDRLAPLPTRALLHLPWILGRLRVATLCMPPTVGKELSSVIVLYLGPNPPKPLENPLPQARRTTTTCPPAVTLCDLPRLARSSATSAAASQACTGLTCISRPSPKSFSTSMISLNSSGWAADAAAAAS